MATQAEILTLLNTLSPAIIGLVGVVVGGTISTLANYILAVRKERAEERREKDARARKVKEALRLVLEEFFMAKASIEVTLVDKSWSTQIAIGPLEAWASYKGIISGELTWTEWMATGKAVSGADYYRIIRSRSRDGDPVTDDEVRMLLPFREQITNGIEALMPHATGGVLRNDWRAKFRETEAEFITELTKDRRSVSDDQSGPKG
jgi:hypothetical protein